MAATLELKQIESDIPIPINVVPNRVIWFYDDSKATTKAYDKLLKQLMKGDITLYEEYHQYLSAEGKKAYLLDHPVHTVLETKKMNPRFDEQDLPETSGIWFTLDKTGQPTYCGSTQNLRQLARRFNTGKMTFTNIVKALEWGVTGLGFIQDTEFSGRRIDKYQYMANIKLRFSSLDNLSHLPSSLKNSELLPELLVPST